MTGRIDFPKTATASVGTPPVGYDGLFFDVNGAPKYKDELGVDHSMGGLNGWFDVTSYGVLTTNTAAQNITAINLLLGTTAPNGSTIYFPGGIYLFNAAWTMPNKMFTFQGQGSNRAGSPATAFTDLRWNANVAGHLIPLAGSGNAWYTQFRDLTFTAITADQASGSVVNINGNVGVNFLNCAFQSAGTFFFDVISYDGGSGSNSANSTVVQNCNIQGFKNNGIRVNAAGSSLVVSNTVIQGQWGTSTQVAAAGISGGFVGALQVIGCDLIGATNNMLLNPILANSEVAASVFVSNTYMDNSFGSCLKITGTGATVRCRFDTCSFTTSNATTALSAVEMSSSFAYTASGQGIDFVNCNILNTFATTGTTNGFLISGTADFSISNSRVAGWTNGVQVTPIATAGRTQPIIANNTIGPAGGYPGNTTGVLLNVGGAAYGNIIVMDNNVAGNTTAPISDAATVTAPNQKVIKDNTGAVVSGGIFTATANSVSSGTAEILFSPTISGSIPANSLRVGSTLRVKLHANQSAAGTVTIKLRFGTLGTVAGDTALFTTPPAVTTVGTTEPVVFEATCTVRAVGASGSILANGFLMGHTAATTAVFADTNQSAAVTVATTAATFLTATVTASAGVLTVYNATIEVINP